MWGATEGVGEWWLWEVTVGGLCGGGGVVAVGGRCGCGEVVTMTGHCGGWGVVDV